MSTVPLEDAPDRSLSVRYQPKTKAFRRYASLYSLAYLGVMLMWGGIIGIILPLHVQQIEFGHFFTGADASVNLQHLTALKAAVEAGSATPTPEQHRLLGLLSNFDAAKASSLSLVTAVGAVITMLIQPIIGVLSDRTRSRWGRRAPWIAAGAVSGGALMALMPAAPTIAVMIVIWSVAQLVVNVAQGPLITTVADRVPERRIGLLSAITGLVAYLAAILAALLAGLLFNAIGLAAYYPFVIVFVLTCLSFALFSRDKSSRGMTVAPMKWTIFVTSFVAGLRDRDYRWAWISKVILHVGYGISTVYSIYMLQSYITPALSAKAAASTAPLLAAVGAPFALIAMWIVGRWSDKVQRRKPFVIAAALIMAFSLLIPFVFPTLPALFVQSALTATGFAVFAVVDQALFIDVLPDKAFAGRDLGMSALGQNLGQALGPIIAGAVVALSAGSYGPVWPVAFVLVALGAFTVIPIKRVR